MHPGGRSQTAPFTEANYLRPASTGEAPALTGQDPTVIMIPAVGDRGIMARVYAIDGVVPVIDPAAFVHPTAVLTGDVIIGAGCYVGPGASLRGDFDRSDGRVPG